VALARTSRSTLLALAAAQVAYGRAPSRPPAATRGIVGAMTLTALAEGREARGRRRGVLPALAAGAIGFATEVAGVATGRPFGGYRYTAKLGPRVAGVPLLAAAAWTMMSRPAWVTAGWLTSRPLPRIALAAGALTAWDVLLDPRMVREGYWTWDRPGRYEGIPASNFAGWFVTSLAVFALFARLDPAPPEPVDDGALALYAWIWGGESFANAALWRQPRTAAAGAAAMGAFAAPALARRGRTT
jgi:putative membrane protein